MDSQNTLDLQQYRQSLTQLALPISLQCLLQSSFSVVDQIMIGQLGSVSIAAIGLGGKFISLLTVMVQAIASAAGIIMAQAVGKKDRESLSRGLYTNALLALALAAGFTLLGRCIPGRIMAVYAEDQPTVQAAAEYLSVYALSFLPMTLGSLLSVYLRCRKETKLPLYAGICSAVLNTGLNYLLIYGKWGFPELGVAGAAWASVIAQIAGCVLVTLAVLLKKDTVAPVICRGRRQWVDYLRILLPMLVCEFLWALGENVYGYIYGHMGTRPCAAITLINPVVSLMIGALSGIAQAAGIMIGQLQGEDRMDAAYHTGKRLMKTGAIGAVSLSAALVLLSPLYVRIFPVEREVRQMTVGILAAFAAVCPIKVGNMILGGGILRSGGKTQYVMFVDMIGTWLFGVPLGFLAAFALKLPIAWVYFMLSLEELVRLMISLKIFQKKGWMRQL